MKMKKSWITVIVLLVGWCLLAFIVDNDLFLPSPMQVAYRMSEQLKTSLFYQAALISLWRCVKGLLFAFLIGVGLGLAAGLSSDFEAYFSPIYMILKSIPNISYILIVLILTNSETAVTLISFMILFPMIYANVLTGMKHFDQDLRDVIRLYPENLWRMIFKVYLPLLKNYLFASLMSGLGLVFKVGIMAEILGSAPSGLGRQFQICRLNLDMVGIYAWTIWVVLFLALIEWGVARMKKGEQNG